MQRVKRLMRASAPVTVWGVLVGAFLGSIITLAVFAIEFSFPPVQIISAKEIDGIAQRGGLLELRYKFVRRRECNSVSASWLWRWVELEGGERLRYYVPLGSSQVTLADPSPVAQEFVLAATLPAAATPGDWFLHQKFLDHCRLFAAVFGPAARVLEDVPVRITAR